MENNRSSLIEKKPVLRIPGRILNYLTYILLLLLAILLIGSLFYHQKRIEELTRINQEKEILVRELETLHDDYQQVKSWNQDFKEQITEHQDHIDRLIREVRFKSNDVEEYRRKMSGLRQNLDEYIGLVDSLKTTVAMKEEKLENFEDLERGRDSLAQLIQSASHLNAYNLDIRTENKRKKRTSNPKHVDHVNICFTLAENIFLESGYRDIYLRILRPDERLIYESEEDLFNANNMELAYTGKVSVDYENTDMRVCILWNNVNADLTEGLYYVNIYADGREIGSRSFLLDKKFLFF